MELFPLVFIVLIFVGIWGSMIVSARVKQMSLGEGPDDRVLDEFRETARLLEARLEQVEDELAFFRDLHSPAPKAELPPSQESSTPDVEEDGNPDNVS